MLLKIHPLTPSTRLIKQVVECLQGGGIIIYPTDTVYAIGCDITNKKAIEKVCALKGVKPDKANFSIICSDISHLSAYTKPLDTFVFRLLRANLPGAFTFILNANNEVPKLLYASKKHIGIRIPDHNIPLSIVKELGHPIITTSLHDNDDILEYSSDAELIYERYEGKVDMVIDGGFGGLVPSTIVDCTGDAPAITRQGKGDLM